jgi:hypothetical protein
LEDHVSKNGDKLTKCAEHGVWTSPPAPPVGQKPLDFSAIDADENQRILSSGKMSVAMVGCPGDPETQTNTGAVAAAITAANDTSFFYHMGDIIYAEKGNSEDRTRSITDRPGLKHHALVPR